MFVLVLALYMDLKVRSTRAGRTTVCSSLKLGSLGRSIAVSTFPAGHFYQITSPNELSSWSRKTEACRASTSCQRFIPLAKVTQSNMDEMM